MALPNSLTEVTPFSRFLAVALFIFLPFIGFFLGIRYQQQLTSPAIIQLADCRSPNPTVYPTPTISDSVSTISIPTVSPTKAPTAKGKKLTYSLPAGWKTVNDAFDRLQIGYNPAINSLGEIGTNSIYTNGIWNQTSPVTRSGYWWSAQMVPYSGGSRHQTIYRQMQVSGPKDSDCPGHFQEKEYVYNGWSCLVLSGICVSQSPQIQGLCPISRTEAVYFMIGDGIDPPNYSLVESLLSTVKVLR